MTNQSNPSRVEADAAAAGDGDARAASGPFVINLCSSTTPMALVHPDAPELKRFSFFVSRRREEGRERFRLHMGQFETLRDAEEWLPIVRDLYPGAWAGEAPGKKLKAAQQDPGTARASVPQPTAPPVPTPPSTAPQPALSAAPPSPPAPASPSPAVTASTTWGNAFAVNRPVPHAVPTLQARPASTARPAASPLTAAAPVPPAATPVAAPVAEKPPTARSAAARAAPGAKTPSRPVPAVPPTAATAKTSRRAASGVTAAPAVAPPVAAASTAPPPVAAPPPSGLSLSNVRQVLADLDSVGDSSPTREMPRPAPRAPNPALVERPVATAAPMEDDPSLTDTQVLSLLDRRRDAAASPPPAPVSGVPEDIELLRPDDLSTMKELRQGLSANAQVSFAVQLEWSVQPIVLKNVPPLAIFSAYTLYTVEGNREGRKWFGLRLGFFSDSISAKQVALYVRSEFAAVAIVPVSVREKARASQDGRLSSAALGQSHHREKPREEFKLLDDTGERRAPEAPPPPPARPARGTSEARASARTPGRGGVRASSAGRASEARKSLRPKSVEEQLEETLEILGAGDLSLDDGRKEFLNDSGVRQPRSATESGTGTFAKLLDRLSDRLVRGR